MRAPLIFDIRRASTTDGPGIRTTVFFKGCNLDCFWCHNPEGKAPERQRAFFVEKCIACGTCHTVCERALSACKACGSCTATCPSGALRVYGTEYSVEALAELACADKPYFDATGGGVTFSGGECMLYPTYLGEVARRCRQNGVSVAVDTAGAVPWASFEMVLPDTDLFLFDIKCLDPALHKRGTGVDNTLILQNLARLQSVGARIIVRVPVIPAFNEGAEVLRILSFCADRGLPVEQLPYHAFGEDKRLALCAEQ